MVPHRVEKEVSRGKRLWFLAVLSPAIRSRIMYVLVCLCVCSCMFKQVHLCSCVEGVPTHRVRAWKSLNCLGRVFTLLSERDNVCLRSMCTCAPAFLFASLFFFRQTLPVQPWLPWDSVDQDGLKCSNLHASPSIILALKACTTTPDFAGTFLRVCFMSPCLQA